MKLKSFKIQKIRPWPLVLGLDVSRQRIKYLLMRRSNRGLKVEGFGRHSLAMDDMENNDPIIYVIHQIFQKAKNLKKAKVVLGLDGTNVFIKKESFPSLSKKELKQSIYFGIQNEWGKQGEESNFVYDYHAIGKDSEKEENVSYLVMAASEEVVGDKIQPVIAEGIIPAKVMPNMASLAKMVELIPEAKQKNILGLLDIGGQQSVLMILKNGQIDFSREIAVGGDDFTKAITGTIFHEGKAIQFTHQEAEEFKFQYGYPLGFSEEMIFHGAPLSEIGAMMRPVVERFIGEVQRSIEFYKDKEGGEEVETLYLFGGGAELKHLPEVLTEKTGIAVSALPIPKEIKVSGGKKQQKIFKKKFLEQVVSCSLALEYSAKYNLLPTAYKNIQRMSLLQRGLKLAFVCVFAVFLLISYSRRNHLSEVQQQVSHTEAKLSRSQHLKPLYQALLQQKMIIQTKTNQLNNKLQYNDDVIQILRLISHTAPSKLPLISFDYGPAHAESAKEPRPATQMNPNWVVNLKGISLNPSNDVGIYLGQLIVELKKSGYFSDVELANEVFSPDKDQYGFELIGHLKK